MSPMWPISCSPSTSHTHTTQTASSPMAGMLFHTGDRYWYHPNGSPKRGSRLKFSQSSGSRHDPRLITAGILLLVLIVYWVARGPC